MVGEGRDLHRQLTALRGLHRISVELTAARDLTATLQLVVDGVVANLGFGAAAINLVRGDLVEVAAVAGDEGLRRADLVGRTAPKEAWERRLSAGEQWGALCYVRHTAEGDPALPSWVPPDPPSDDPEAWHPLDALFAPLYAVDGGLIGVLSVDLPEGGRRPDALQCELLEMFAAAAGNAIDNARLRAELAEAIEVAEQEKIALRASEESFRAAFEEAPSGMAMARSDDARLIRVNGSLSRMLGFPAAELVGRRLADVAHPDDRDLLPVGDQSYHGDVRLLHRTGRVVWVSMNSSTIPATNPAVGRAGTPADTPARSIQLIHVEDISERHYREEQLAHLAAHEPLTGLPNRAELRARLEQLLTDGAQVVVLYCDLDQFKAVNDQFGHHAGDEVLVEIARRLRSHVRKSDTVARVGGDEFVIVLRDVSPVAASRLADRVAADVSRPVRFGTGEAAVTASIGVAPVVGRASVDEVLRRADAAMYAVKKAREQRVRATAPGSRQPVDPDGPDYPSENPGNGGG